jgi:hypothetical protein
MNWTMKLIEQINTVRITSSGIFDADDDLRLVKDIISQNYWKPGMNMLLDHRGVEFEGTDINLVRRVSEHHKRYEAEIGAGKMALLMKSLTDFARGRQFELLTEYDMEAEIDVFLDEDKALEWLRS